MCQSHGVGGPEFKLCSITRSKTDKKISRNRKIPSNFCVFFFQITLWVTFTDPRIFAVFTNCSLTVQQGQWVCFRLSLNNCTLRNDFAKKSKNFRAFNDLVMWSRKKKTTQIPNSRVPRISELFCTQKVRSSKMCRAPLNPQRAQSTQPPPRK